MESERPYPSETHLAECFVTSFRQFMMTITRLKYRDEEMKMTLSYADKMVRSTVALLALHHPVTATTAKGLLSYRLFRFPRHHQCVLFTWKRELMSAHNNLSNTGLVMYLADTYMFIVNIWDRYNISFRPQEQDGQK